MPYDIKDSSGKVVATFDSSPTQQDLEDLDTHLQGKGQAQPAKTEPAQWSDTPKNILPSASKFVGGIAEGVAGLSPYGRKEDGTNGFKMPDTVKNLGNLILGEGQKIAGGAANLVSPGSYDPNNPPLADADKTASAVNQHMSDRYGGLENAKQTAITDPVGTAADLSTLLGMGGAGLKAGGLAKTGEMATTLSKVSDPLSALIVPAKLGAKGVGATRLPEKLYQSAAKMRTGKALSVAERDRRVATAFEEGIPISKKGIQSADDKISSIEDAIQGPIDEANAQGVRIDNGNVADNLTGVADKYKNQARPGNDLAAINKGGQDFFNDHPTDMPIADAQLAKKGTYQQLKGEYGKQNTKPNVEIDIDKSLAHGLMDEVYKNLSATHPELASLGKQEGSIIALKQSVEDAVKRIENRNLFSLLHGVLPVAGGAIAGKPGAWAALGAAILDQPSVKSNLALALAKTRGMNPLGRAATPVTNALYQTGTMNQISPYANLSKLLGVK